MTSKRLEDLSKQDGILILTSDRRVDRRILLFAASLAGAGWDPRILAMPGDHDEADPEAVTRVSIVRTGGRREHFIARGYRLLAKELGAHPSLMQTLKGFVWSWLADPETYYQQLFWPAIQTLRPKIIIANDLPMLPVAAKLKSVSGARLVYDSHELYPEQAFSARVRSRWAAVESRHVSAADVVITVNESIAAELSKRHGLRQVQVILNAERCSVPPHRSTYFHMTFGLPPETRILLFQGGLTPGRNLGCLVTAMSHIRAIDVVLVLLGDGEIGGQLKRLIRRQGVEKRVYLHPAVAQEKLLGLTAAADAGIIPYQPDCLNNRLCSPNKLFEFIAAGIPILASDLPELRKFVKDLDIGLVGDLSRPEVAARCIDEFFIDERRLKRWHQRLASVRREVSWEAEEKKLIRMFEALR